MSKDLPENWRELSWRACDRSELEKAIQADTRVADDLEEDLRLTALLARLSEAPVPSNFTSRVVAEATRTEVSPRSVPWVRWNSWLPRLAFAVFLGATAMFSYRHLQESRQLRIREGLEVIATVAQATDPEVLQDFEAIRAFNDAPAADEELLSLLE
jgi:anti-sigma factor RsiW